MIIIKEKETSSLKEVVKKLKDNKCGIIPTETIFGLCMVYSPQNRRKLNQIKNSPENKEITTLISDFQQLEILNIDCNKIPNKELFKTGKLTLLIFNNDNKLTGIKWTNIPDLKSIISETGPLLLTSVNMSGEREITCLKDLDQTIKEKIDFILHGQSGNVSSTIVNCETNEIIRSGEIKWKK